MKISDEKLRQLEAYLAREDGMFYEKIQSAVKGFTPPCMFSLNAVDDRRIPKLIELLNSNSNITSLSLSYNTTNVGVLLLAEGLKYVTKLHLECLDFGKESSDSPETLLALAKSKIREIKISHCVLTNELADLLIDNSKQIRLNLRDNRHVDDEHVRRADKKAEENSAKEFGFFGSPTKKPRQNFDEEKDTNVITPPDKSPE